MKEPVFIFGTGGHARDVAEVVHALDRTPVFITRDAAERDAWTGADAVVIETEAIGIAGADFAMGIGDLHARARVAQAHAGLRFPALVHPDTSFARGQREIVAAAHGTIVSAGVRLMAGVTVGVFCVLNLNVTVSHDCEIGDFVNLSPGANIAGNVRIDHGVWIGVGAVVNQGTDIRKLEIGTGTVVGSGAVILKDCEAQSVYVGNPARKIR